MPTQVYTVGGKRVPSVTTILGKFKDPGPLQHWSWQIANDVLLEAHSLIEKNGMELAEYLRRKQQYLQSRPLERANYRNKLDSAASAGTIAHEIVSHYIQHLKGIPGTSDTYLEAVNQVFIERAFKCGPEIAEAANNGVGAFRRWVGQNKFQLEKTEVPLTSRNHLFGGCLDCLGTIQVPSPLRILFDWKTSSGVYADYIAQVAAYVLLWEENYPAEPVDACHLLRFDKVTADFSEHCFTGQTIGKAQDYFLHLRACYEILKDLDKRVN